MPWRQERSAALVDFLVRADDTPQRLSRRSDAGCHASCPSGCGVPLFCVSTLFLFLALLPASLLFASFITHERSGFMRPSRVMVLPPVSMLPHRSTSRHLDGQRGFFVVRTIYRQLVCRRWTTGSLRIRATHKKQHRCAACV